MGAHTKDVLLCVSGLTPQVITETVYALAVDSGGRDKVVPDDIHVVTTTVGRQRIQETLLDPVDGQLARLRRDYGLAAEAARLPAEHIHLIRNSDGEPVDDIRTQADNAGAADLITRLTQQLTASEQARLHVSIAGGRKTMGFYAGYALSLYGRACDRLSHVLVNLPFEAHADFFYPPPHAKQLRIPGTEESVSTNEARVVLGEIPFVRLRDGLGQRLLDGSLSFGEAVARAQQALTSPELNIDLGERQVWLQGVLCTLSPTQFVWLTWFAERARHKRGPVRFDEAGAHDLLRVVDWLEGSGENRLRDSIKEAVKELSQEGHSNYFERNLSRLNSAVQQSSQLPPPVADRYRVRPFGSKGRTTYALKLAPEQIHIVGEP